MTLATEQGFPYWLAYGTMVRGEVLVGQGQVEEGIAQMRQGMAASRATGARSRGRSLPLLAAAYAKVGRVEEGLSVVAEALARGKQTGERGEAELYRLQGLAYSSASGFRSLSKKIKSLRSKVKRENTDPRPLTLDPQAEAEGYFLKAIEIARSSRRSPWSYGR